MAKDSISIKWNSGGGEGYEASVAALRVYDPAPQITAGVRIKGRVSPDAIAQIVALVAECGAEIEVSLKAEWDTAGNKQMRLFPPDYGAATASDIEDWLRGPNV